jgi:ferredoxin-NADP reductase
VPLRAMLRHYVALGRPVPLRLLYSARSLPAVVYRDELSRMRHDEGLDIRLTLTREQPVGWAEYARRIDLPLLAEVAFPSDAGSLTFICGPTGFVEAAAGGLVELGHEPSRIRTERFGPTGT